MPYNHSPPAMPAPPDDADDAALKGGKQGECIGGFFEPGRQTLLTSSGMTACSAVFLRIETAGGAVFGAVVHFDGSGDPKVMFREIMAKHGVQASPATTRTFLVTHRYTDMTGKMAYNCLVEGGFPEPTQYIHNGAAAMDAAGNIFDHYL